MLGGQGVSRGRFLKAIKLYQQRWAVKFISLCRLGALISHKVHGRRPLSYVWAGDEVFGSVLGSWDWDSIILPNFGL